MQAQTQAEISDRVRQWLICYSLEATRKAKSNKLDTYRYGYSSVMKRNLWCKKNIPNGCSFYLEIKENDWNIKKYLFYSSLRWGMPNNELHDH